MKHGSLFSGIGGFDLASEWMGWENVFHCEIESFPRKILHHYWPNAISYEDIKKTDFSIHKGGIDIITGGFPCQPYSMAGKRKGKEDERHLWPEMLRAIREIQPRWVVGENVFGLINWNGGLVFDEVQSDLEAEGYEVQAYVLPAASVNAPHRRDRVWFVAYNNSFIRRKGGEFESGEQSRYRKGNEGCHTKIDEYATDTDHNGYAPAKNGQGMEQGDDRDKAGPFNAFQFTGCSFSHGVSSNTNGNGVNQCNGNDEIDTSEGGEYALGNIEQSNVNGDATDTNITRCKNRAEQHRWQSASCRKGEHCPCGYCIGFITNTESQRQEWEREQGLVRETRQRREERLEQLDYFKHQWKEFPTQSPICSGDDGLPTELDGITFSKWRNESIKGYGNAIVPQVVLQIFKAIEEYESRCKIL